MITLQQIVQNNTQLKPFLVDPKWVIRHLSFDTRSIIFPQSTLFFALQGTRKDGHIYIKDGYALGCRSFVVASGKGAEFSKQYPDANFLESENIIVTLQSIAKVHRAKFNFSVIGITGSNGKTWVKEWLFESLHESFQIVRSPGSYNSQIGVALSVWDMNEQHDLGIFEAGISAVGEMKNIEEIIRPCIGIFTGLGDAHQSGFSSLEEKLVEKLKLFEHCQTIIYNGDDDFVNQAIIERFPEHNLKKVSLNPSSDNYIDLSFTPFKDVISLQNAALVAKTMEFMGCTQEIIEEALIQLSPMEMRLQIVDSIHGSTLINDSYSLDLNSLNWALRRLNVVGKQREKMVILSDIFQHDKNALNEIAEQLVVHDVNSVVGIGTTIQQLKSQLPIEIKQHYFETTEAFLKQIERFSFKHKTILLKGSRLFKFEKIANYLTEKNHTVSLHVDFNAMLHNLQYFGKNIANGTKVMAVIKASAYGSGSVEIARFLSFFKMDYFAVAVIDEGISLRRAGIKVPILVLNPDAPSFDTLYEWNLEPEVYSLSVLKKCIDVAIAKNKIVPIHIKLNTGMNRLGFDSSGLLELIEQLTTHKNQINIKSIFTHLSSVDQEKDDESTHRQVKNFDQMYAQIVAQMEEKPWRHVLNTNGILRFPAYDYEMVRLGIGLYGIGMGENNSFLQPVHSLSAKVIQLRALSKGDSVGYNNTFFAEDKMRVATVNIGYADGVPRLAGNGKFSCIINGQEARIIGRICMDMLMCDVSHLSNIKEGQEVWIFNHSKSLEALAKAAETIPYEILSQISPRVKRVFHYL